tara:strand:- start:562 stop:1251 length:690 start_codon:yes stop_codon:yes gene_type:complete
MKISLKTLLISGLASLAIGCGGGGGGGTGDVLPPTEPITTFPLFPSDYLSEGYQEYYPLNGSDNFGNTITGRYAKKTQAQTTFNSEPAIPIEGIFSITIIETGEFVTSSGVGYLSTDLDHLRFLGDTSTVSAETTALPRTAEINDFGHVGTYIDDEGDRQVTTWELVDGGTGKAKLILSTSYSDEFGRLKVSEDEIYTINESGQRLSIEVRLFSTVRGVTWTLTGANTE